MFHYIFPVKTWYFKMLMYEYQLLSISREKKRSKYHNLSWKIVIFSSTGQGPKSLCHGRLSVVRPSVRLSVVNNFGVATITRTNFIRSVSNFGNRKVPRRYRSSSNLSKIGQPELGYLPLNFFNFSHFWGVATITRTNIIRSVSNFGNRTVPRKYRSSSNMSKIGQPELGYLPLNFFNFSHFRGVATITPTNIVWSVSNFGNRRSIENTGQVRIWAKSVNRNWVIHTCDNSQFPGNFPVFRRHKLAFQGNSQFFKPILSQTLKLKSRFQFLFLFYLKRKVVYSAYNSISLCMQASKHKNKHFL